MKSQTFYLIKNHEGKYFSRGGIWKQNPNLMASYPNYWVDEPRYGDIYPTKAGATSKAKQITKIFQPFPPAQVVEVILTEKGGEQ